VPELIDFINTEEDIQEETPMTLKHATMEEYFKDLANLKIDLKYINKFSFFFNYIFCIFDDKSL
jgi:hypothetical protein